MKKILTGIAAIVIFAACGDGEEKTDFNNSHDYVDSTNVLPNSTVNPGQPVPDMGNGAGLDTVTRGGDTSGYNQPIRKDSGL